MAEALISIALEALIPEIRRAYGEIQGVTEELENLKETLSLIQDVLEDAEQKQFQDKAVQKWLGRLRDVAYDAEDILDEWATKARITQQSKSILPPFKLKFRLKMAKKIKKIRERFEAVQKQSSNFYFMPRVANARKEVGESSRPPTDSLVIESQIWGREDDKKKVIESLLNGINNEKDVFVLPIVGMGGVGKTTLAQLVFNNQQVVDCFDLRIWVCVSENFELIRLTTAILQSISSTKRNFVEFDRLRKSLQEKLEGKKFLLVLDDVWNEDPEKWDRLKRILNCSKESAIIVTTRIESIASMMGSGSQPYKLEVLSRDHCWTLFKHRAFGGGSREESQNLVDIGKQIVKKCGGLPLAANALGSLLFSKSDEDEWVNIRDSETWKLSNAGTNILPALRLSYDHLPLQLRRCFVYSSIFPKDHVIEKENLIYLWIANDFILSKPRTELEDVGNQIFNELVRRSLLQVVDRDGFGKIISCKIHDLLHDLARYVTGSEFVTLENGETDGFLKETRHLFCDGKIIPKSLCDAQKIHSLLLTTNMDRQSLSFNQNISNLRWLRVLDLSSCHIEELSYSIGNLLHLRYLNLSWNGFTTLPESVSNLQNLQILLLKSCFKLTKLPKGTRKMSRLRHLDITGCFNLMATPNKIGQLISLQKLPIFIVGNESECEISQLGDLNLRGELSIKRLERVKNGMDPQEAKLFNKKYLRVLTLSWDESLDDGEAIKSEETLNNLQPCEKLEELMIFNYPGNKFSSWLQASLLPNLVEVQLRRCYNCQSLPPLGQLPRLKHLHIEYLHAVKYIGVDFYGEDESKSFPSLQEFTLKGMYNLEEWSFVEDKRIVFPCLNKLSITNLKKLSYFPEGLLRDCTQLKTLELREWQKLRTLGRELDSLVALELLTINSCVEMECVSEEGIRGLTCLRKLKIEVCDKLTTISPVIEGLPSLKTLKIYECKELMYLPEGIEKLIHLQSLTLCWCKSLTSFPQDGIGGLTSLMKLELLGLPKLTSLLEGIGELVSLEQLEIGFCSELSVLPATLQRLKILNLWGFDSLKFLPEEGLASLRELKIQRCENLTSLPEEGVRVLRALEVLVISECAKLSTLPAALQQLTIRKLFISGCHPELLRQVERKRGEEWLKIAHIPIILTHPRKYWIEHAPCRVM